MSYNHMIAVNITSEEPFFGSINLSDVSLSFGDYFFIILTLHDKSRIDAFPLKSTIFNFNQKIKITEILLSSSLVET
jgi:hypothetical protein